MDKMQSNRVGEKEVLPNQEGNKRPEDKGKKSK